MPRWLRAAILATLAGVSVASGQTRFSGFGRTNLAYDGRVAFVRLRWTGGSGFRRGTSSAWDHDFPRAEQHLSQIIKELTYIDIHTDDSLILTLDDPELFKHPIAYMWEPGFWALTEREAERFRDYLLKGGFAVFEDFEKEQWNNFEAQMHRVLPSGRFVTLDETHRLFDSFFRMKTINFPHPMFGYKPSYLGIFEDNDPSKRLMVVADYDNDVPEYWEWSGTGLFPFDASNEAYKLGVNYMIYGMTH
jgi:hypothetical protein